MSIPVDRRIVLLVDMDCFYCQVEENLQPALSGQPIAVVQHNEFKGGGIIAVNYPARAAGVNRHMRGADAQALCPAIQLVRVPTVRGKADLSRYRDAGKRVAAVLAEFTPLLERASVDEAYMDVTAAVEARLRAMDTGAFTVEPWMLQHCYALGYDDFGRFVQQVARHMRQPADGDGGASDEETDDDAGVHNDGLRLLVAATICSDVRRAVKERTGYDCSAGIAHNKILAKLVAGMNKPNKQTLLAREHVDVLYATLSVRKIRGLGGKFGEEVCERLKVETMAQLAALELGELLRHFEEKNAHFLYNIARGHDPEPVVVRLIAKNIGCSKRFQGIAAIKGLATLRHWLGELTLEIVERIAQDTAENQRQPRNLTVGFTQALKDPASGRWTEATCSRTVPLSEAAQSDSVLLANDALDVIRRNTEVFLRPGQPQQQPQNGDDGAAALNNAIRFLAITVGKFEKVGDEESRNRLRTMFSVQASKQQMATTKRRSSTSSMTSDKEPTPERFECDEAAMAAEMEPTNTTTVAATLTTASKANTIQSMFSKAPKRRSSEYAEAIVDVEPEPQAKPQPANTIQSMFSAQATKKARRSNDDTTATFDEHIMTTNRSERASSVESTKSATSLHSDGAANSTTNQLTDDDAAYDDDTIEIPATPSPPPKPKKPTPTVTASDPSIPAYMLEYAEFHVPAQRHQSPAATVVETPQPRHVECATCGESVAEADAQLHADAHLASDVARAPSPTSASTASSAAVSPPPVQPVAAAAAFERCSTCNKRVPLQELQSHADAHYAYQLSQQQRAEYRSQLGLNQSVSSAGSASKPAAATAKRPKPPNGGRTSSNAATPRAPGGSSLLKRFLQTQPPPRRPPSPLQSQPADATCERVACTECDRLIAVDKLLEHSDYHAARRLQRELNASSAPVANRSPARPAAATSTCGKSSTASAAPPPKKTASVARFFTASQPEP